MNKRFIESIYKNIVEDNTKLYKKMFDKMIINDKTIDYWKRSLALYEILNDNQKEIFFEIINQVIVDTISQLFGTIDGSCSLYSEKEYDIKMFVNGIDTDHELQDSFLEYIEEKID